MLKLKPFSFAFLVKKIFRFPDSSSGYVMILVAFLIPIVLAAVNYAIKRVQTAHKSIIRTSSSYAVAHTILGKYNPGKTWSQQHAGVYSAAFQALCDRAYELNKTMASSSYNVHVSYIDRNFSDFSLAKTYYVLSSGGLAGDFDLSESDRKKLIKIGNYRTLLSENFPASNVVFNASDNMVSFRLYTREDDSSLNPAYNVVYYPNTENEGNKNKLEISLDTQDNFIKCDCNIVYIDSTPILKEIQSVN
jgi:hypothetical protein